MRTSNHQYLQVPGQEFGHGQLSHDVYGGPAPQAQQQTQQQQQSITQHYQPTGNPPFEISHPNGRHTFEGDINNQAVQAAMDTSIPQPPQRQEVPGASGYEHYNLNGMTREDEERRMQMQMQNRTDSVEYQKQSEMEYQREMEVYQRELDYQQQQQQHMQMEYHQMQQIDFEQRREEEERRRLELDRQEREYERCQQTQQYQVPPPTQAGYPSAQASQHPQAQYDGYCDQGKLPPPDVQSQRSSLRPYTSGHDAIYHPSQPAPPPQAAEYQHQPQATMHGQTLNVVPPQQYLDQRETVNVPSSGEPVTPYDGPVSASQVSYVAQSHQVPHEQQQSYTPATYSQYWAAAPSVPSHALDQQQHQYHQHQQQAQQYSETQYQRQYQGQHQGQDHIRQGSQHQPFTPGIVLRDIAADDSRLQDTWMTYMYNVSCDSKSIRN